MKYIKALLIVVLVMFPILTLPLKKANSIIFYLLFLIGLVVFVIRLRASPKVSNEAIAQYWPLNLAMGSMMIAVMAHQILTGDFQIRSYDLPFHLACFGILFSSFLLLESKDLKLVQWGLVGGVLVSLATIFIVTNGGNERPAKILETAIIPFSNHATLLGFLAFLSIKWIDSRNKWQVYLKVLALLSGLSITVLSQTRGGWLVLPLYGIIGSIVFFKTEWRKVAAVFLIFITMLVVIAAFSSNIQNRIALVRSDISSYMNGTNVDTSVGLRFQFWSAAIVIAKNHWVAGIGDGSFNTEMEKLSQQKVVTLKAAGYPHPHNEILFQAVRYGLFGVASILAILFVPFFYFAKYIRHSSDDIRVTAWMGISVCLGFFTFGLTDVVLVWRHTVTYYIFFVAVFMALIIKHGQKNAA